MFSKSFIKTVLLGVSLLVGNYAFSQVAQETASLGVKALESTSVQNLIRTNPALAQAAAALLGGGGLYKGSPEQVIQLRDALAKANSPQASELAQALYGASIALKTPGLSPEKIKQMSTAEFVKISAEKQMKPTMKEATGATALNNKSLAALQLFVTQAQKAGMTGSEIADVKKALNSPLGAQLINDITCFQGFEDKNAIVSIETAVAASLNANSLREARQLATPAVQHRVYADETLQQVDARLDAGAYTKPCQILNSGN